MSVVFAPEDVVTLEDVEAAVRRVARERPDMLFYDADRSDEFPLLLGFTERCQISTVFAHLKTLRAAERLHRKSEVIERGGDLHQKTRVRRVYLIYTSKSAYLLKLSGRGTSGHFVG